MSGSISSIFLVQCLVTSYSNCRNQTQETLYASSATRYAELFVVATVAAFECYLLLLYVSAGTGPRAINQAWSRTNSLIQARQHP